MLLVGNQSLDTIPPHITRIYALVLNMMRDRTERADVVAVSDSLLELQEWEAAQREATPYDDLGTSGFDGSPQTFRKVYKKGGPLEWYNPPDSMENADEHFGHGVRTFEKQWARVA